MDPGGVVSGAIVGPIGVILAPLGANLGPLVAVLGHRAPERPEARAKGAPKTVSWDPYFCLGFWTLRRTFAVKNTIVLCS